VLADTAYDGVSRIPDSAGQHLGHQTQSNPKTIPPFDKVVRAFSHLKDWSRVATRYDKRARNYRATVTLAILVSLLSANS
jgi:transposase